MSNLTRKPPPVMEEVSFGDFSFDIEEYMNKSPITSRFREDNPNLQPTISNDSVDDGVSHNYNSLDPSIVTPPSPPMSSSSANVASQPPSESTKRHIHQVSMASSTSSIGGAGSRDSVFSRNSVYIPTLNTKNSSNSLTSSNIVSGSVADCNDGRISTPYWKYHVLKFGKDLYLTTNPGLKHMYCRNGPGFYVEITNDSVDGFTMTFKDAETQSDKSRPPIMVVQKKPKQDGGYFTATLTRSSTLKKNMIKYCPSNGKPNGNSRYNGLSLPQAIPEKYIPYDRISNLKSLVNRETNFMNYEVRDFTNMRWNIGSIPRVRISKMNKIKTRLNESQPEQWKFVGKRNIYFHQNYIEGGEQSLPFKTSNPQDIYLQNSENNNFPPVLSMFRPHKQNFSSRVRNLNKKLNKKKGDAPEFKSEKLNTKMVDNDISEGQLRNYYIAGDGLYYNKSPEDDLPDENKLGWLTIYEDRLLQERGMFDLVVGLTLAVGYHSNLSR
ncbi:hypothetical protein CANTEDRAFT_115128 [Yamadazyma tenuis ATCC 10573]|uniref:Uncharacterized protein n=1 Tax=Candida tenuis (strain ATCC 10573 / BCRC 21748 / CBS 615 / JCM 9827 / NBRC 10315 / NRRL Y-1498 / VKM Y-70) TaxID=590646 RepID=G3B7W0_CANTC|nr:uncharacterized protein CANTEDRAFT_115128 [Yamadazyma tenuis ATCC 10573]EGV61670.1 hypothetical protein CANTEDRAFT_115128 [Yamadazyma tenuis ATCC 10573]